MADGMLLNQDYGEKKMILALTRAETETLRLLLGHVGGTGVRLDHTVEIQRVLDTLGLPFPYQLYIGNPPASGAISFLDPTENTPMQPIETERLR
jgi:hypothetical protein